MDTKALRQKILDLAIRGKLVPQDPNDEPASVLLERIRAEKQQMVKDGKLKPKDIKNDTIIFVGEDNLHYEKLQDGSVKCIEDEIPFELPEGWAWSRANCISDVRDGTHDTPAYVEKGVPLITSKNLTPAGVDYSNVKYISVEDATQINQRSGVDVGDILFAMIGTIGNPKLVTENTLISIKNVALFKFSYSSDLSYILRVLEYLQEQMKENPSGGLQPFVSLNRLRTTLLPIAPITEQNRIVEKLENLLRKVDLINYDCDELDTLIKAVKSKILDLAIRGQLVPQDPNDEPASVLLERIRAEKEELIKQGKIKRDKKKSIIFKGEDNSYYLQTGNLIENLNDWDLDDIPESWSLCCMGELCDYGNCINVDTEKIANTAWILDLEDIEKDSGKILQKVRKAERNSSSTKHLFKKGQVLYSKLRPYLNKVVIADEDGYCTAEILPLDFIDAVLPQYALYYLMSPTFLKYANRCSYGIKMPRLGTTDGKKAVFAFPPYEEQKRICSYISKMFDKIDNISNSLL